MAWLFSGSFGPSALLRAWARPSASASSPAGPERASGGRAQDQRAFLKALLDKAISLDVFLDPFIALPFGSSATSSISVDQGTHLYDLVNAALARRDPLTGTVPSANANASRRTRAMRCCGTVAKPLSCSARWRTARPFRRAC